MLSPSSPGLMAFPVMAARCVRLSRRSIDAMITALMLRVILMLLFVYVFGGAILPGGKYVSYLVPGVLLLCAGFGAASTAVSVCQDMTGGIVDRLRSLDVPGPAVLAGPVAARIVRDTASTVLGLGLPPPIGFPPPPRPAGRGPPRGRPPPFVL